MSRIQKGGGRLGIRGYTIVEVMIFLVVSGGLLISVMATISGQQAKTEFNTSVRDFENKMIDLLNDVQTGYYGSVGYGCTKTGAIPKEATTFSDLGTNADCVFIGKALRFHQSTATVTGGDKLSVYLVAGIRTASVTNDLLTPPTLATASPTPFSNPEVYSLPNGLEVYHIIQKHTDGTESTQAAFTMVGSISGSGFSAGTVLTSTGKAQLISTNNAFNTSDIDFTANVKNIAASKSDSGVILCVRQGAGGRKAAVTLGVTLSGGAAVPTNQPTNTEIYFDDDVTSLGCPTA